MGITKAHLSSEIIHVYISVVNAEKRMLLFKET